MVAQPLPSADDWTEAYQKYHDISYILKLLQPKTEFSEKGLRSLSTVYRHPLREKRVKLLNSRIVIMNPIGSANRFLTLIVVPKEIRRIIFHACHTTPMGAHMGRYKILLLIRLNFFWPGMRKDIFTWISGCAGCIPAQSRIRESAGLAQSWPITTPFAIISVDLWQP